MGIRKLDNGIRFEYLPEEEYEKYERLYMERALKIKDGIRIEPTDWAIQNGLFSAFEVKIKKNIYFKVRNCRNEREIIVKEQGNKSLSKYWAGFWKEAKP